MSDEKTVVGPDSSAPAPRRPDTLVICVNRRFRTDLPSCAGRGSEAIADAVEREIKARRLAVRVLRIRCFGQCSRGPTMRLAPGGEFMFRVEAADVPALIERLERDCGHLPDDQAPPPPLHLLGS